MERPLQEKENLKFSKLPLSQKILFFTLCALVALMVIFSLMAIKNKGQDGYDKCVQNKCEKKGQDFCQKPREIQNCCLGAGGNVGISESKYVCVFD